MAGDLDFVLGDPRLRPWPRPLRERLTDIVERRRDVRCNVCGWSGPEFRRAVWPNPAGCPRCGAAAEDRYLYRCWTERIPFHPRSRVLQVGSRLGRTYRRRMAEMVTYLSRPDLGQALLGDEDVDVLLSSRVPAGGELDEIHRLLRRGGTALIAAAQSAHTAVDWGLTERLRDHGFATSILVTEDFLRSFGSVPGAVPVLDSRPGALRYLPDMVAIASIGQARRLATLPGSRFLVWEARKPEA